VIKIENLKGWVEIMLMER